jgi:hypothetical protein
MLPELPAAAAAERGLEKALQFSREGCRAVSAEAAEAAAGAAAADSSRAMLLLLLSWLLACTPTQRAEVGGRGEEEEEAEAEAEEALEKAGEEAAARAARAALLMQGAQLLLLLPRSCKERPLPCPATHSTSSCSERAGSTGSTTSRGAFSRPQETTALWGCTEPAAAAAAEGTSREEEPARGQLRERLGEAQPSALLRQEEGCARARRA